MSWVSFSETTPSYADEDEADVDIDAMAGIWKVDVLWKSSSDYHERNSVNVIAYLGISRFHVYIGQVAGNNYMNRRCTCIELGYNLCNKNLFYL